MTKHILKSLCSLKFFLLLEENICSVNFITGYFYLKLNIYRIFFPSNIGIHSRYLKTSQTIKKVTNMTCPNYKRFLKGVKYCLDCPFILLFQQNL